jgi:hypothetical protein
VWDQSLKISYPDFFNIARSKNVWVVDHMEFRDGNIQWNIIFTRSIQDWEVDVFFSFFKMLYSLRVKQWDMDRICLSPFLIK